MDQSPQNASDRGHLLPVPNATVPYWRSQPHRIDEYRSSEQLPAECDIAILGAGMAGVSTAYHLTKLAGPRKPSIVILEARQACSGATGRNGGHAKLQTTTIQKMIKRYGLEVAEEFAAFTDEQIYAFKDAVESEGIECEFELRHSFDVFIEGKEAKEATKLFKEALSAKQKWTREVDLIGEEYAEQITSIRGAKAALSKPVCSLWPYKFVVGLLAKLVDAKDVELHTWTPVTSIEHGTIADRTLLHTPRGTLRAKKVILATNAYTGGVCGQYADHIIPTKGTACHIAPQPRPVSPHLSQTYNINYSHRHPAPCVDYLNPRPDGGIVVGGAKWMFEGARDEWDNNWDDSAQLPGVRAHFDGLMQRYFAGWQDSGAVVDHIWTGIQGFTKDDQPHVGEVPGLEGRQYIIAGFNGGGMSLIFLCARGLAQMVYDHIPFSETGLPRLFEASSARLR